ncbi:hypothetical protein [Plastoroseomonas arctica]|uniref:UrcA family protein n=1 Tax=Plastoroseomonas arctica TaxID=1509237 RepID=A0AAF1KN93_9PROT|nr:hypothetical protein [Plastoroseomonas arctica]MBR0654268.1 hypothetical protein [Plastoroseomonas arctica]
MRPILTLALLLAAGPALAQFSMPSLPSTPSVPSLGGQAPNAQALGTQALTAQTPEERRAFCQRVGSAASSCGLGIGAQALTACLIRTLPTQDSLRVARVANDTRGDATSVLRECGVGTR